MWDLKIFNRFSTKNKNNNDACKIKINARVNHCGILTIMLVILKLIF